MTRTVGSDKIKVENDQIKVGSDQLHLQKKKKNKVGITKINVDILKYMKKFWPHCASVHSITNAYLFRASSSVGVSTDVHAQELTVLF